MFFRKSITLKKVYKMKKIVVFFIILLFVKISFSQEIIVPEKRMYKDSTERLFVNKFLPLYFKISSSPNQNSEHFLLTSETTPQYCNPLYLPNEGLNEFYSPWAVDTTTKKEVTPKRNVIFEIYTDSKPPTTKINNNITSYSKGDILLFNLDLKVWFSAKDETSGVGDIFLSINQAPYEIYKHDTLTFEHGNVYFLQYYSADNVGNYEKIQSVKFQIDSTKPLTNLEIIGTHSGTVVASNCKVSLKPQDAFSGTAKTYYYIDNQKSSIYTSPISVSNLSEGKHTLKYFSEDNVSNKEKEKSFEFYIDKTPPMVLQEVIGDFIYIDGKAYTSGRSQIQLTAIDNKAGVDAIFYSFDFKNWIKYETPINLTNTQKDIKVYYYAVDKVGNKTSTDLNSMSINKFFMSEMDLESPDVKYSLQGVSVQKFDTVFINSQTKVVLTATDKQSGLKNISYQVDKNIEKDYKNSFTINEYGLHRITAFAFDKVNNLGTTEFNLFVDTIAPQIFVHFSTQPIYLDGKKCYPIGTKVFVASTDKNVSISSIKYKINNDAELEYKNYLIFSTKGEFNLQIKATDQLGNESVENFLFQIK